MTDETVYGEIKAALAPLGLIARGGFYPEAGDDVPLLASGHMAKTLIMIGNAGGALWEVFPLSPEAADGEADPLDRWTARVLAPLALRLGAELFFPFGGGGHPFARWAQRAEAVAPSPLGLLIHPEHGLWHAYRGAFAFAGTLPVAPRVDRPVPCDTCAAKPCLDACPVGAFASSSYDVPACATYLTTPAGNACLEAGCQARRACPVAAPNAPVQASFHMAAFFRSLCNAGLTGNE
ncbi:MAG: ferredoxin [Rhodospirillaceae bacterium]|nr:MAG: ferredoxin [Rhodospirillaceae bacterium]